MVTVTSQEFNRNPTSVKRKADEGPVYITEHGTPAYVVLSATDYARLTKSQRKGSLANFLRADQPDDYELPDVPFEINEAKF